MGGFFQGWRRKVGCISLMMTCVFAAGWVRSITTFDCLRFDVGRDYIVVSFSGHIYWGAMVGTSQRLETVIGYKFDDPKEMWSRLQILRQYRIDRKKAELRLKAFSKSPYIPEEEVVFCVSKTLVSIRWTIRTLFESPTHPLEKKPPFPAANSYRSRDFT